MSRKTEICDIELDDEICFEDEQKDEVFKNLSLALVNEKRLLNRFYEFCDEYTNFDFDESGINFDDASELTRKAKKIGDLLLHNIEASLLYKFDNIKYNIEKYTLTVNFELNNYKYNVNIKVMNGSFNLEVL